MPQYIRNNFIFRRVWNNVYEYEKGATFLVIGDVGTGKSTGAITMAAALDPNFNIERITFTASEFMNLIDKGDKKGKLGPGSAIIFDEAAGSEEAMDSRNSLSNINKTISQFATISRAKRLIIFYVAPFLEQMDKRIRKIGLTGIFCFVGVPDRAKKRSTAFFYWSVPNAMRGWVSNPHPRQKTPGQRLKIYNKVSLPLPHIDIVPEYKDKKMNFIARKISDWNKQYSEKKELAKENKNIQAIINDASKKIDKYVNKNGKMLRAQLRLDYNIGDNTARSVGQYLVLLQEKQKAEASEAK
jgi:energy-coupling factor transporter ATP-binding protein EcfA2